MRESGVQQIVGGGYLSFYGRCGELEKLEGIYNEASDNKTCIVSIVGDTGLGKTRLIQEFYNYLSNKLDPTNYWPDISDTSIHSTVIAPNFIILEKSKMSDMPYLWLGLRCFESKISSDFIGNESALGPIRKQIGLHLLSFYVNQEKNEKRKSLSKGLLSIIANFAFPGGGGVIVNALSTILNGADLSMGTYDAFRSIVESFSLDSKSKDSCEVMASQEYTSLVDQTIEIFSIIFSKKNNKIKRIPIVLVVDDVQWADEMAMVFLRRVIDEGVKNSWPLMIITTCWEKDFKKHIKSHNTRKYGVMIEDVNNEYKLNKEFTSESIYLKPLQKDYVNKLVREEIKNIDSESIDMLDKATSGDLELLFDTLKRIKSTPGLVKKNGGVKNLRDKLKFKSTRKKEIIRERLNELGIEVLYLLSWGSIQGVTFSEDFILRCKDLFGEVVEIENELFEELANPENIIMIDKEGKIGRIAEFKRQVYYEIAYEILQESSYFDEVVQLLLNYYNDLIKQGVDKTIDRHYRMNVYEQFLNFCGKMHSEDYYNSEIHARIELARIYLQDGAFKYAIKTLEVLFYKTPPDDTLIECIKLLIEASIGSGMFDKEKKYIHLFESYCKEEDRALVLFYRIRQLCRSDVKNVVTKTNELLSYTVELTDIRTKYIYLEQIVVCYFYAGMVNKAMKLIKLIDIEFGGYFMEDIKMGTQFNHTVGLLLHNIDKNKEVILKSKAAIEGYKTVNDRYKYLLSKVNYSDGLMGIGQLEDSYRVIDEVYKESKESNYVHAQNIVALCYGNVLMSMRKPSIALYYYEEGIQLSKKINHSWDEYYGRIWRSLTLSIFSEYSSLHIVDKVIKECRLKEYDYLVSLGETFRLLINWNLGLDVDRNVSQKIYQSLDDINKVPGLRLQTLSYLILVDHIEISDDVFNELEHLIDVCEGVKGMPIIISEAFAKISSLGYSSTKIEDWIYTYINPIKEYYSRSSKDWSGKFEQRPRLNKCNFVQCEAMCCYDGVYLEDKEEDKIKNFVEEHKEYFKQLPSDYIVYGEWMGKLNGRKTEKREYEYKSGNYPKHFTRTRCVFAYEDGICSLQLAATENDLHPWKAKPIACWMAPISTRKGDFSGPPKREEKDSHDMGSSYPGYIKCLPCAIENDEGENWSSIYKKEIEYYSFLGNKK